MVHEHNIELELNHNGVLAFSIHHHNTILTFLEKIKNKTNKQSNKLGIEREIQGKMKDR